MLTCSQRFVAVMIIILAKLAPASAQAEGTISGTIKLEGRPKPLLAMPVAKDVSVCGKEIPSEALIVGANGGLGNVVVAVTSVKRGAALPQTPNAFVDQVKCRYTPHVQAVTVGTKLALVNNDAVVPQRAWHAGRGPNGGHRIQCCHAVQGTEVAHDHQASRSDQPPLRRWPHVDERLGAGLRSCRFCGD